MDYLDAPRPFTCLARGTPQSFMPIGGRQAGLHQRTFSEPKPRLADVNYFFLRPENLIVAGHSPIKQHDATVVADVHDDLLLTKPPGSGA